MTSSDGFSWTSRTSGTTQLLNKVYFENNLFVCVGESGTILTSAEGITWTARTSLTTNSLHGITFGNNAFIAVGDAGKILMADD